MEPLEIYDAINNKVIRVYVSTEVAEKCRTDTDFAQDLFNKLQDQDIEEGCAVEVETIKSEEIEEIQPVVGEEGNESAAEEKLDKEVWSRHETLKLIKIYQKYKDSFKEHKQRRVVWAMVAAELSQYNVFKSATKCAEKWKNLIRTYKVANDKPNTPTRFQYYQEMKEIFSNTGVSISDSETDEKEMKYIPTTDSVEMKESYLEEVPEKESWSRYETLKFLKAFQMLKHMKQNFSKERHFWSIVSAQLAKDNIHKPHEKCAAKWKNLLRSYRKNLEKPNMPTRFQYFQEVSDVLNDTELEISDHIMRITDDVEKIVDPEQFKTILAEAEYENCKDPVSWAADETLKLIQAYKKHKQKFNKCPSRKFVWAVISSELASQGINRDVEKVENKWKSLLRSYRKGESKGGESTRFYFYDEMNEALNNERMPTAHNGNNSKRNLDEDNSLDKMELGLENPDHSYSENPGFEQIIIQTEPDEPEGNEKHWTYSETSALLSTFSDCKKKFKDSEKAKLWKEVSKELKSVDINKSAEDCEKKWKKMFSEYKIHKLNKLDQSSFQFYQAVDDILKDELQSSDNHETVGRHKSCKCSEQKMLEKQNRHIERMQMLKRKLDLEERKVNAFELYVKHLRSGSIDS